MTSDTKFADLTYLSKRATAAALDMCVVGMLCFGLQWSIRLAETPRRSVAVIFAAMLCGLVLAEMFNGWTIGKSVTRLSVRTAASSRVGLMSSIIRAVVREFPVAVFVPSLFVQDGLVSLLIWGISLTIVCCYVATAYLTLVRIGRTPFDLAAGTVVGKRDRA